MNGHRQPLQQRQDVLACLAAEDAELVLQADRVEPSCIDVRCCCHVVGEYVLPDLTTNRRRIVVGAIAVGHGNDRGNDRRNARCDRLLQIRGERRDTAAARQRIADKGDAPGAAHTWISQWVDGRRRQSASPCPFAKSADRRLVGFTGRTLQKGGHGLAGNVSHEASYSTGTDVHSYALSVDEDRFTAGDMKQVEPGLSLHQKHPDLAVGIDLPIREGGKVDLLEDEIGARCNDEPCRRQAFRRGLCRRGSRDGRANGGIRMQFAITAMVEQSKRRVAALLNLGDHESGANRVNGAGRDDNRLTCMDNLAMR